MRLLRFSFASKFISILLLILILESTLHPTLTYALTTGPHQPEYISYEGPGSTDMVNLSTGDFTFSLPILDVPGPEGSFSVPLSYHAGIGVDQESSWVGLGWTLNPGAITRSIVEYPDDASGETQSINVKDLNVIRGWTSSILGLGQIGWNNQTGHSGTISLLGLLDYSYDDNGTSSLGVAGVNFSAHGGVTVDPVGVAMAAMTIASFGASGATAEAGKSVAGQIALDFASGAAMSTVFGSTTPDLGTGFWKYNKSETQKLFHKEYHIWLDKTRYEQMVGVLNLGGFQSFAENYTPTFGSTSLALNINSQQTTVRRFVKSFGTSSSTALQVGVASDMSYYIDPATEYHDQSNPSGLATDDFNVSGPGISGRIKPYRLDIGSVSMPREMSEFHDRLQLVPFNNYKVPFIYEGSNSANYFYHAGNSSGAPTTPVFNPGINSQLGSSDPQINTSLVYDLNDYIFGSPMSSEVSPYLKIPQQNDIEWYSNQEIKNPLMAISRGFIDFTPDANLRTTFRSTYGYGAFHYLSADHDITDGVISLSPFEVNNFLIGDVVDIELSKLDIFGNEISSPVTHSNISVTGKGSNSITLNLNAISSVEKTAGPSDCILITVILDKKSSLAIGGYSVTDGNGLTYHYALPVYDRGQVSSMVDKNDSNKSTTISRMDPFANTWLLTAVTGPDFYDKNQNGYADEADWGYWVRFNYGKYDDSYNWRIPYSGTKRDGEDKVDVSTEGVKELYYLNSIQTRTHTALFLKDQKLDGKEYNGSTRGLRLAEIYLLTNDNYHYITSSSGLNEGSDEGIISKLWTKGSMSIAAKDYLKANAIKRIEFVHSYDLAAFTTNSVAINKGKLTLDRVRIYGKNSMKIIPDFVFEYGFNPDYNKDYWDTWGYYNAANLRAPNQNNDLLATAWSLTKVITPLGHTIEVEYERDVYTSIWGSPILVSEDYSNLTSWSGSIAIANPWKYSVGDHVSLDGIRNYYCLGERSDDISASGTVTAVGVSTITVDWTSHSDHPQCQGSSVFTWSAAGAISKTVSKKGDGLRVSTLTTTDDYGISYESLYKYYGGSLSREPDYLSSINYTSFPFNLPDFPNTPVIYGLVDVMMGKSPTTENFDEKREYQFETPKADHIVYTKNFIGPEKQLIYSPQVSPYYKEYLTKATHLIDYYTSRIGRINSIQVFNSSALTSTTTFSYLDELPSYQGLYTEGTLIADRIIDGTSTYDILGRTLRRMHPNVLYKSVTTKDGFVSSTEDTTWDFFSGAPTHKKTINPSGLKSLAVTRPARQYYSQMGPKAYSYTNKNMLNQVAAEYVYKLDAQDNVVGVLGGHATTWKGNWDNYRYFDGANYTDGTDGSPFLLRKHQTYSYKGNTSSLQSDGTFSPGTFLEYNFSTSAPQSLWQRTQEYVRYDHFSVPVETKDINGIYSATKTDINGKRILASASNSNYNEFAYSGAEDGDNTQAYFGGEVARKNGTVVLKSQPGIETHTGQAAVQVTSGNKSFSFKPGSLDPNRIYRVSVWTNSMDGAIYYDIGSENTITPVASKKAGNWYQINLELSGSSIYEVGVKSLNGTVTFDDFRFQPLDAAMTATVYDAGFGQVECVLDNQNMFTRYEYNDAGLLTKTYRETFQYGEVLVSESKQNYRRFNIDQ